jgi:hypothetical protein
MSESIRADQLTPGHIGRTVTVRKGGGFEVTGILTGLHTNTQTSAALADVAERVELGSIDLGIGETHVEVWPATAVLLRDE